MSRDTGKIVIDNRNEKKNSRLSADRFFVLYFTVISLVFAVWMTHCDKTDFHRYSLGMTASDKIYIKDGESIEQLFCVPKEGLKGLEICDYSCNGNDFSMQNAQLNVQFWDENTGELLQETTVDLQYEYDMKNLYVSFVNSIPEGTLLRMHLNTKNVRVTPIYLQSSEEAYLTGSLRINGKLSNRSLCARLVYPETVHDYLKPILYFAAELLAGLVLLYLYKCNKVVFAAPGHNDTEGTGKAAASGRWFTTLAAVGMICVCSYIFWEFISYYAVEKCAVSMFEAVPYYSEDDEGAEPVFAGSVPLKENDSISQIFYASGTDLGGIALRCPKLPEKGSVVCEIFDYSTQELVGAVEQKLQDITTLEDLNLLNSSLNADTVSAEYVVLSFGDDIQLNAGQYYGMRIYGRNLNHEMIEVSMLLADGSRTEINEETVYADLDAMLLLSDSAPVRWMFKTIAFGASLFLICYYLLSKYRRIRIEYYFLAGSLIMGILFSLLIPPYCVPDEKAHIDTAYRLSNILLGVDDAEEPDRIYKRVEDVDITKLNTMDTTTERYRELYRSFEDLTVSEDGKALVAVYAADVMNNVTFFNYLPTAAGFSVARLLGWNHMAMVMLGRLMNLLAVSLLMTVAIRHIPIGKTALCVLGMVPMMLQQNTSCSYDGMVIAGLYLFMAFAMKVLFEQVTILDLAITLGCSVFVAASKGGAYVPLLGIGLLPLWQKTDLKKWFGKAAALIVIYLPALLAFAAQFSIRLMNMFVLESDKAFRVNGAGVKEPVVTLGVLITSPVRVVRMFQNTFLLKTDEFIGEMFANNLGRVNIKTAWFLIIGFLLILIFACISDNTKKIRFNKLQSGYLYVLLLADILLVMSTMLLAFTLQDAEYIMGIQGRYFLPTAVLFLILLAGKSRRSPGKKRLSYLFGTAVLNMITAGIVITRTFVP